jgi:hypothetical protein
MSRYFVMGQNFTGNKPRLSFNDKNDKGNSTFGYLYLDINDK